MARTRAGAARAAFGRVDQVRVTGDSTGQGDVVNESVSASDNAAIDDSNTESQIDSTEAGGTASTQAGNLAVIPDSIPAGKSASPRASSRASGRASRPAGKKAGKARRRVGRPRGPERVPVTIRILAANDRRLTAAVEQTGDSPQYIVDAALAAYLDALGIPKD
jgi:hypothetical protein